MITAGTITVSEIAKMIDHSLLHPTMTDDQIKKGCDLARKYKVATVCVKPYSVPMARTCLSGSDVGVCSVIGFPHGNSHPSIKAGEAELAIAEGASEIDMVVNIGKVLGENWDYVSDEIKIINDACVSRKALLKVIFENDYLEDGHIVRLCEICSEHSVAFAKTSTGYGFVKQPDGSYSYKGAIKHHLELMRRHCKPQVQIKAAGGVRSLDDLLLVRALGVSRVGATATQAILEEAQKRSASGTLSPAITADSTFDGGSH